MKKIRDEFEFQNWFKMNYEKLEIQRIKKEGVNLWMKK
jgi:hypothetical protein